MPASPSFLCLVFSLCTWPAVAVPPAEAPPAILSASPVGFGSSARGGTIPCIATTEVSLRQCTSSEGSSIAISGRIFIPAPIYLKSHTTLRGVGRAVIISNASRTFVVSAVTDLVIQNLHFSNPRSGRCAAPSRPLDTIGCGVSVNIIGGARDIWIDHNTFSGCGEKCVEVFSREERNLGGAPYPVPTGVTVSGNRFLNSYFGMAAGVGKEVAPSQMPSSPSTVTFYGNLCNHVFRRCARAASGARLHEFNNVVKNWELPGDPSAGCESGFGPSSVGGAELRLENNYYSARPGCADPVNISEYEAFEGSRGTGRVAEEGDAGSVSAHHDPVFSPPYVYGLEPADIARGLVEAGAGAGASGASPP